MHAVNLISAAILTFEDCPALPCDPVDGLCAVTGKCGPCVPRKKLLGKSFTNGDILAAPESDMVSVDAYIALKYKWERMSSWACNGVTFARLKRAEIREHVLTEDAISCSCAYYATTSYKKHGALRAPVNPPGQRVWLFETRLVDCSDMPTVRDWWERLNAALNAGIGRTVIESLDCPAHIMRKATLPVWMDFEGWARPRHNSALYAFLSYLLPSKEERDAAN